MAPNEMDGILYWQRLVPQAFLAENGQNESSEMDVPFLHLPAEIRIMI